VKTVITGFDKATGVSTSTYSVLELQCTIKLIYHYLLRDNPCQYSSHKASTFSNRNYEYLVTTGEEYKLCTSSSHNFLQAFRNQSR
jgi:transcriptional antiterminator Rof (Rho-off)